MKNKTKRKKKNDDLDDNVCWVHYEFRDLDGVCPICQEEQKNAVESL